MCEFLRRSIVAALMVGGLMTTSSWAQDVGTIRGTVTLIEGGAPVHGAMVLVVGPGLVELTDEQGEFTITNVSPGDYEILAQREHLTAGRQMITVAADTEVVADFVLSLSPIHEEVTVTATAGGRATTFEAFNATSSLDSFDLVASPVGTLGEALENQPGIAKRGFGPGASRPVVRGFDGDRVLVMEDGIRTGDLSSQSGDHGVNTDPNGLDRVEIVRGPATLLFGSNAVGGLVNAITPQENFRAAPSLGTRGQFTVDAGSNNAQAGTFGTLQHAQGNFLVWAGGGARRTDDYETPEGVVENSKTRLSTGRAGLGYAGDRLFASGGFTVEDGRYGIPFAGEFHGHEEEGDHGDEEGGHDAGEEEVFIDIDSLRRVGRFDFGMRNLTNPIVDGFQVVFNVVDWNHDEIEIDEGLEQIGTQFDNRTYIVRAEFDQQQTERLTGKFGIWSQFRDFAANGEEDLAPPTEQAGFAAFAYEELNFGRYQIQLGARLESNDYTVAEREGGRDDEAHEEEGEDHEDEGGHDHGNLEPSEVRDRDFLGGSASVGFRAELGAGNAFVSNFSRSHRAPALEELYNFGPHVGNLVFEVGNPDLDAETTLGLDLSLRHRSNRVRGDFNFYVYDIDNFVFLDIEADEIVDGLGVGEFLQGDGRFTGFDAKGSVRMGGQVWANLGLGFVDAELTSTNEALPRIPPFRGSVSVDIPYRGFSITPELLFAAKQDRVFRDETGTDGYAVLNLRASHVWPSQHMAHVLSVSAFNLTNELYRNHTSFIKDLAPEIGRGVRVGYSLRFF